MGAEFQWEPRPEKTPRRGILKAVPAACTLGMGRSWIQPSHSEELKLAVFMNFFIAETLRGWIPSKNCKGKS